MFRIIIFILIGVLLTPLANATTSQNEFTIAGKVVKVGEIADLRIDIPAGKTDPATFIPITVINGANAGPTVLLVAGVHGFEFAPILAAQQLAQAIDPAQLKGRLIIVRVAHVAAFEARSPFVNPFDRKNLNRSFPGIAKGTQTERIAYALSSEVIPKADFVFDIHSGDGAEWLEAFVGVYGGPLATDYDHALSLAQAFGFDNIVRYKMNTQEQIDQGRSLNRQAVAQGLPTLLIEIGQNGQRNPKHVDAIVKGIENILKQLKMTEGVVNKSPQTARYFDGTSSVKVAAAGLWHPRSTKARFVSKGDALGVVRNYGGELIETILSPIDGYTLYGNSGPPVREGDAVVLNLPVSLINTKALVV